MDTGITDTPLITSRRNPLVRRLKSLASRAGREEHSLLLLEGTHLLQEVLRAARQPKEIVATTSWLSNHHELVDKLLPQTCLHEVTATVLEASLTTVNPDGVATIISTNSLPKSSDQATFVLALDRLQDPGNLGTLLRTAMAADVESVWLASGADPLSPKVVRASAGAILQLPHVRFGASEQEAVEQLAKQLKQAVSRGFQVVGSLVPGSDAAQSAIPYWDLDWQQPTVLVLGNEGSGLHPCLQACCSHGVTLPHSAAVESLNVAAAAAPLLLERRRATMTSHMQQSG